MNKKIFKKSDEELQGYLHFKSADTALKSAKVKEAITAKINLG